MSTHWRVCQHSRLRYVYRDPIVRIGICYECRMRVCCITALGGVVSKIFGGLVDRYGLLVMGRVFGEDIRWWKEKDF